MSKEFADKLWVTVYNLHGTVDMPELCRLMIFAMFIKYAENKEYQNSGKSCRQRGKANRSMALPKSEII